MDGALEPVVVDDHALHRRAPAHVERVAVLLGVHPQQAAAVQVLVVAGFEGGLPAADEGVARRERQPQQRPRDFRRRPLLLALCSLRLGVVFVVRERQRAECWATVKTLAKLRPNSSKLKSRT